MKDEVIFKLANAERVSGVHASSSQKLRPYKRFDNIWIRADAALMETYKTSIQTSEIQFYPNKNLKSWIVQGVNLIKFKNIGSWSNNLFGIGLFWPFTKVIHLPLSADIIYYRHRAVVMVYTRFAKPVVIKVAITDRGIRDMRNETESQRLAGSIKSNDVFIPAIIKETHNKKLDFSIEEYFIGVKQSFKNKKILQENYKRVFKFLIEFYLKNPIELQDLSESKYLNHLFVEEFIRKQKYGDEILSIYRGLNGQEKKMIKCRIHGDLNHKNVLSNDQTVCIIDWGQSKHNYLSQDLDNSSYDTKQVFEKFVERAMINKDQIYSYEEQLFLGRYIELSRAIHNGILRKTNVSHLSTWTKQQNQQLLKMGEAYNL